jgi:23S rRNA (adenine2503-C2)-methyltransferase
MQDIKDLSLKELELVFKGWGVPTYRAQQVFSWIYERGAHTFEQMSNLPLDLRLKLKDNFYTLSLKIAKILRSQDGTAKFLFELKDKNFVEAVSIPVKERITACLSTQVGCKFACKFCASGLLGFKRNLTCGEIIEELLYLKQNLKQANITHAVFMGIGEPFENYDNVLKAIRIINSKYSFNIGARRITVSTSGVVPAIKRLADENLQIELSISLHASDDKTRALLMPINKKYPLKELILACSEYIKKTGRQITFEYVLINKINSDLQNARKLSTILKGLKLCKVNLIPANPIEELKIEPPKEAEVLLFRDYIIRQGINVTLRRPRGRDIEAACGQLKLRYDSK